MGARELTTVELSVAIENRMDGIDLSEDERNRLPGALEAYASRLRGETVLDREGEKLVETIEWIPVGDRLPENDPLDRLPGPTRSRVVMISTPESIQEGYCYRHNGEPQWYERCKWDTENEERLLGVTHWAELPKGPKR